MCTVFPLVGTDIVLLLPSVHCCFCFLREILIPIVNTERMDLLRVGSLFGQVLSESKGTDVIIMMGVTTAIK